MAAAGPYGVGSGDFLAFFDSARESGDRRGVLFGPRLGDDVPVHGEVQHGALVQVDQFVVDV